MLRFIRLLIADFGKGSSMALGLGKKKKEVVPNMPQETEAANSTPLPSWLQGEAPQTPPRRKKPRVDSGGQLTRQSMRAA
jgi:hypothetical protein